MKDNAYRVCSWKKIWAWLILFIQVPLQTVSLFKRYYWPSLDMFSFHKDKLSIQTKIKVFLKQVSGFTFRTHFSNGMLRYFYPFVRNKNEIMEQYIAIHWFVILFCSTFDFLIEHGFLILQLHFRQLAPFTTIYNTDNCQYVLVIWY